MTEDFQALIDLEGQDLVLWVFSRYKNLIRKKAYFYNRASKGRIDVDDFVSDSYINLTYYMKFINIKKVNQDKFMFYIYVSYAISKTLKEHRKCNDCVSIEQNELQNVLVAPIEQVSLRDHVLQHLYEHLTSRQIKVLELKQSNPDITYRELGKKFGVCLQTIIRDVQLAKETYNQLFGTNFKIGR